MCHEGRFLRNATPRSWSKFRSFVTEIDALETSVENSLKETHSIESSLQKHTTDPVPRVDNKTHRTFDYNSDATVQKHLAIKHQRM